MKLRASLLALALLLVPAAAWADSEGSHPLTDRPFPGVKGISPPPPFAVLLWKQADGRTLRRLGEAKLVELKSGNPQLTVLSVEVTGGRPLGEKPYGKGIVGMGAIAPPELTRLQAQTPVIITVDLQGRIHRVSQVDHWPTLSAIEPRMGRTPDPPKSTWQRFLDALLRR